MEERPVDPLKAYRRAEHDAMLDQIRKSKGQAVSNLVGADGNPLIKDVSGKPKPEGIVVPGELGKPADQQEFNDLMAKQQETERLRREELGEKLKKKFEEDKQFGVVAGQILTAWRLLFWLMNESLTFEGVSQDMINHLSDASRASALSHGYSLSELVGMIRNTTIPTIMTRLQYYSQRQKERQVRIKQIQKRIGANGVALPCNTLESMFRDKQGNLTGFHPGKIIILHGVRRAIKLALDSCARSHKEKNDGNTYYLRCEDAEGFEYKIEDYITYMASNWWKAKADNYNMLEETLEPIRISKTVLVVIEELGEFNSHDGTLKDQARSGLRSLGNLYQWADENHVCFIIGDVIPDGVFVPPEAYSPIPHCAVAVRKVGDEEKLIIGTDILELNT